MYWSKLHLPGPDGNRQIILLWRNRAIVLIADIGTIRIVGLVEIKQKTRALQFSAGKIDIAPNLITLFS